MLLEDIIKYKDLNLLSKQVVEGFITGIHKSPFHGFSVEFAEHRQYNKGESTKHIDWKLFGKTDRLYIKKYQEETNLRCHVIVDSSSSMNFPVESPRKKHFSVIGAAAILQILNKQRDGFALHTFTDKLESSTKIASSLSHYSRAISTLELLRTNHEISNSKTNIAHILNQLTPQIHRRSLVVIFSDMLNEIEKKEEIFAALQRLKHNKNEIILFNVVDKKLEIDFEFENRPYQFIDLESGEKLKLNPQDVKESYIQKMHEYEKDMRLNCTKYGIEWINADVNESFDQLLLPFLLKRQKMN